MLLFFTVLAGVVGFLSLKFFQVSCTDTESYIYRLLLAVGYFSPEDSAGVTYVTTNGYRRKVHVKKEEPPVEILIVYGSQSGTAETLAYELETMAKSHNYSVRVVDIEEFEYKKMIEHKFVTFLIATHGEGEPTDSTESFWEWVQEETETDLMGFHFAVFGLGNTQYEFYNAMGKGAYKHLSRLSAKPILDCGLGDDDGTLEDDFAEWLVKYWKAVDRHYGREESSPVAIRFESRFEMIFVENWDERVSPARTLKNPTDTDHSHLGHVATLVESRELLDDCKGNSTLHLEFALEGLPVTYETADTLSIAPRNNYKLVAKVCKRLGADPDQVISMALKPGQDAQKLRLPKPCTIRNALLWYTDLTHLPRKNFVHGLAQYASNEVEQQKIQSLCSPEGKDKFKDWLATGISVLDILLEYPSVNIPIGHFIELLPRFQCREYTISSSHLVQPNRVAITAAIIELTNPNGCAGVCTQYLRTLRPGIDQVSLFVKPSAFHSRPPPSKPIIMIGPGTGLAPFRGFIQDGNFWKSQGEHVGEWSLFFGCRDRSEDFIYRDELKSSLSEEGEGGCLSSLHLAFSREQPQKVYVQDKICEQSDDVWRLIDKDGAYIYICGSIAMGRGVREALCQVISQHSEKTEDQATDFLHRLTTTGRFIQELWG